MESRWKRKLEENKNQERWRNNSIDDQTLLRDWAVSAEFPNFNVIPCQAEWLEPKEYGVSLLCNIARKIFNVFKRNRWDIPGCKVVFGCYGWRDTFITIKVHQIQGSNFILRYDGDQEEDRNGRAGLGFVMVPNVALRLYSNNIYKYNGINWKEEISNVALYWYQGHNNKEWETTKSTERIQWEQHAKKFLSGLLESWIRRDVLKGGLLDLVPIDLQWLILDYGLPEIE